jgi:hypothetical protein
MKHICECLMFFWLWKNLSARRTNNWRDVNDDVYVHTLAWRSLMIERWEGQSNAFHAPS